MSRIASKFRIACLLMACVFVIPSTDADEAPYKPKIDAEVGRFYVPNAAQQGTKVVGPDDEVLRQPILWGVAAKIESEVRFSISEGDVSIPAGTILPAVSISDRRTPQGSSIAYCTNVPSLKRKGAGLMGVLGNALIRSLEDGRKCLVDEDGDGLAEHGFLLDDGNLADRKPRGISPVALNIAEMVEVGPGDYVSILARKGTRPSFQIVIYQNGKQIGFDRITTGREAEARLQSVDKNATYPLPYEIYGARFEIRSFDPRTGYITIAWPQNVVAQKIPVPSEIRYQY